MGGGAKCCMSNLTKYIFHHVTLVLHRIPRMDCCCDLVQQARTRNKVSNVIYGLDSRKCPVYDCLVVDDYYIGLSIAPLMQNKVHVILFKKG